MKQVYVMLFVQVMLFFSNTPLSLGQESRTGVAKKIDPGAEKSALSVDQNYSVTQLVQDIFVGDCFEVSNIKAIGSSQGIGHFTGGSGIVGFNEGVVLSTGSVMDAPGPNFSGSTTSDLSSGGDPDLNQIATGFVQDAAGIEFDFVVPPTITTIAFEYVFASEEYNEYVCSSYNDVFGFFISGPGYTGPFTGGGQNIALVPGTNMAVSINTINNGNVGSSGSMPNCESLAYSDLFINNLLGQGLEYDGFTSVLYAVANVVPCETYHIRLVVGDVQDGSYDSAVFLKANGFSAGGTATVEAKLPYTSSGNGYECCSDGYFRFERNSGTALNVDLSVPFSIGGSAVNGVDYEQIPNAITIPAGEAFVDLPINIFCDGLQEGQENIVLQLEFPCLCENQSITLNIKDAVLPEVNIGDVALCEGMDSILIPSVTGGVPDIAYLWSNNTTASTLPFTAEDTWFVLTVTDACGNSDRDTAYISLSTGPELEIVKTDVDCPGAANGIAEAVISGGTTPLNYTWNTGAAEKILQNLSQGNYAVTVTDFQGCKDTASVFIHEPPPLGLTLTTRDATCFGDENGRILIDSVWGGTPPYELSLNGTSLPPGTALTDLAAGTYLVDLIDGHDCLIQDEATIYEPAAIVLDLGEDLYVDLGETVDIRPVLNLQDNMLESILWTPAICEACLDTVIMPLENMHLSLTVIDTQGCTASDNRQIVVKKNRNVYVPNVFSPNNDGVNDFFMIFAGANVQEIKSFEIFDRWGGKVFSAARFQPNDPAHGWDGKHKGHFLNDNVFTWKLVVDYVDGKFELLTGDVTVMK